MWFARAFRTWCLSVVACAGLLAVWATGMQLVTGRMRYLVYNVLDVSVPFTAIFAVIAAVLYIPAFGIAGTLLRDRLTQAKAVALGAALSPATFLAIVWRFRETEDPASVAAWVTYWATHLPALVFGSLPYAAAGAAFGLLWSASGGSQSPDAHVPR